ncbi:hypothetical protein ACFWDN_21320 [Micromonospora chalcea]
MKRKPYRVTVSGRDDSVAVDLRLTEEEADAFRFLGDQVEEAQRADAFPCAFVRIEEVTE